jgi:DNA-binding MarR family transcriptional regulator
LFADARSDAGPSAAFERLDRIGWYQHIGWVSNPPSVPFETTLLVRDACLCLHVQRAARALARRFDLGLRAVGLTNGQFSLLMSLNRPEPATMASVASLLAMDRTTLTAALKPLQRQGLATVVPDPGDQRARRLALTPEGRRRLAAAVPIWTSIHAEVEHLVDGGPEALRADLRSLSGSR